MKRPVELDGGGRAQTLLTPLKPGEHKIRATYTGGGNTATTPAPARISSIPWAMCNEKRGMRDSTSATRPYS